MWERASVLVHWHSVYGHREHTNRFPVHLRIYMHCTNRHTVIGMSVCVVCKIV